MRWDIKNIYRGGNQSLGGDDVAETQTYNDGVVKIYETSNTADPGNMPVEGLALKCTLRYDEKIVGINRYYIAMQNDIKIDIKSDRYNIRKMLSRRAWICHWKGLMYHERFN